MATDMSGGIMDVIIAILITVGAAWYLIRRVKKIADNDNPCCGCNGNCSGQADPFSSPQTGCSKTDNNEKDNLKN